MKCFYHEDADGICAGFLVRQLYPDVECYPINYGRPFPFEIIEADETVFIVDFSIEPSEMAQLLTITEDVIWIDHHRTAIDKYSDFSTKIKGLRYDGIAGCMLTWCYLYNMVDTDGEPVPLLAPHFVKLIADWDVWTFEYGDNTRKFQAAFTALNLTPASHEWNKIVLDEPFQNRMITTGDAMLRFRDGWAENYVGLGFETLFEGHRCFALNLGRCNSDYFKSVEEDYDILMPFVYNGSFWTVSLYSKTIDVSEIAKKHGGGGHQGAAGFQCAELPFGKVL